jgi:hypothetical protein
VLLGQPAQRVGEDHRIAAAVGVEEANRSRRTAQHGTDQGHDRGDAAASGERHQRVVADDVAAPQQEPALGWSGMELGTLGRGVVEPVRHHTTGISLDGDLQVILDRCRGHRVAALQILPVDGDPHRQELACLVPELRGAVLRNVEHQRHGIGGLAHDPLDAKRREAVRFGDLAHRNQ